MSKSIAPAIRRGRIFSCLVAFIAMLVFAAQAQARPLSRADRAFVDATVEEAMREEGQPGVEISIAGPKGSYTQTYGVRQLGRRAPLSVADHFRIGSITKTFTGTAVLRQIERGHMSFDDTVSKWISGIPYGDEITVRDLLAMRSGLFEYELAPGLGEKFTEDPTASFSAEEFLQILRESEPEFAPGEATQYNNSNYFLLGIILEKVTGESAYSVITKTVIRPLGLNHTSFPASARMPFPFAHGYCGVAPSLEDCTEFSPEVFFTDGSLVSTIGDMTKYGQELGTGALLSPAMFAERKQFCPLAYPFEGPTEFGYGLGLISFGSWLGHDGSVPGYGTETMYEPKTGTVIAGVETLQTGPLSIFSRIFERIGAHLVPGSMDTPEYQEC